MGALNLSGPANNLVFYPLKESVDKVLKIFVKIFKLE